MSSYKIEDDINFLTDWTIDLTHYKNIKIRYGSHVYKLDIRKFLKEFGSLIEIINDSKVEE